MEYREKRLRVFACSFLNKLNMGFYSEFVSLLKAKYNFPLRPVPELSHHITLAFIERLTEDNAISIQNLLSGIEDFSEVRVKLDSPRVMYSRNDSRLLYSSVINGNIQLRQLRNFVIDRIGEARIDVSGDSAKSIHVTLGRFKRDTQRTIGQAVEASIVGMNEASLCREDYIRSVEIVSSKLTSSGPIYTILRSFPLKSEVKSGVEV